MRLPSLSVMPFSRSASLTASVDSPGVYFITDMMREVRSCVLEYRESFTLKETAAAHRPLVSFCDCFFVDNVAACAVLSALGADRVRELCGYGKIKDNET